MEACLARPPGWRPRYSLPVRSVCGGPARNRRMLAVERRRHLPHWTAGGTGIAVLLGAGADRTPPRSVIDRLEARHAALLEALAGHEVRFVVVGGVALQLHGYSGVTVDVDVTIATDTANGRQIEAALASINAQPYLAGPRGSSYRTQFGRLEVMRSASAVGDYDAWMLGASSSSFQVGCGSGSAAHLTCCSPRRQPIATRIATRSHASERISRCRATPSR